MKTTDERLNKNIMHRSKISITILFFQNPLFFLYKKRKILNCQIP